MSKAHASEVRIGGRAGSGDSASNVARFLSFAAAPTFAVMALWTGAFGGEPNPLCVAAQSSSPLSGMELMYLLMSAFHSAPWLKLMARCRQDIRCF